MKSIFTKTLLAAAIAGVASANAATIGTVDAGSASGIQPQKISMEGYDALGHIYIGDTTTTNDITVTWTSGINYTTTDLLTLTVAGGTIANTAAGGIKLVRTSGTGDASVTAIGLDTSTGEITFRPSTSFDNGDVYELRGVKLTSVGSSVAVSAKGRTIQGIDVDQAASQTVATKSSQFSVARTTNVSLNRVIDVEKSRKQFTAVTGSSDVVTDGVSFDLTSSADLLAATVTTATFALEGSNLEFLKDGSGKLESGRYSVLGATAVASGTGAAALNTANTVFSFTTTTAPSTGFGVNLIADGVSDADGQALAAQSFEADLAYNYSYTHDGTGSHKATTGQVAFTDQAAGSWTLSGANVDVEFMPFGGGITQFIYITNKGSVSGDIEVTAYDESGTQYGPVSVNATATGKSVTNVGAAVVEAMTTAGVNTSTGRVAFTLTINSPSGDIEVTAGYNARGNRVLVK